ncbi:MULTISPECIES: zinc ABC transporter substrate-binding protein ZnuA [unclassified Aminobacter]|uniref:zinc ABC transporter substrate-binding protein ZnuA n=1 Tax=unclassified Aminobacter TaxID=2644704 RepID=UPI000467E246|nr:MULTISPECIES: zinc ABC transporter substrate-binding protein ZnuA [unclassified Aminobacter]TWH36334.1 zinc transport system substrate-binding protein [Aminobacter sp. J15]
MANHLRSLLIASAALVTASPAFALDVVASIKPVHSLVAAVMEGVGEPDLIVSGSGSEHVHSLRPSDAQALQNADVVFWIGEGMETYLVSPLGTLSFDAKVVALADTDGLEKLPLREGGPFEAHEHDHDGHEHPHSDHDHDHDHDHDAGHAHEEGHYDLHFWLDPLNAKVLVQKIETVLSEADPENRAAYAENARRYGERLDQLVAEVGKVLDGVREKPSIVFHDAYQYFEHRFGVNVAGSITVSPEVMPGAQRLNEITERVKSSGATCIFAEPQFEPKLVTVVAGGTEARTGVLDPLGAELADGPELYIELIRNMAKSFKDCLSK